MEVLDNYNLRINHVIDILGDMMLQNPNIVGVGRGNKTINGYVTKEPALGFMVVKKSIVVLWINLNLYRNILRV